MVGKELRESGVAGVAEWGIELLPGSEVFSVIFCSLVWKELRESGVTEWDWLSFLQRSV
jgi:hypothetical protein